MKSLDSEKIKRELRALLIGRGPLSAQSICQELRISQPSFSRFLEKRSLPGLLRLGQARATRYALRKAIPYLDEYFPLYQITSEGKTLHIANLHPLQPKGFWLEPKNKEIEENIYPDLPYFLDDLRPSGFLGRLIPLSHPELQAPGDIQLWTVENCLAFWSRYGWSLVGNFIIGEGALKLYLAKRQNPTTALKSDQRSKKYPIFAKNVTEQGDAGSSAGGEQPKFLVEHLQGQKSALVKFSPPLHDAISQRVADLLVCEHIASKVLLKFGIPAAQSEILCASNQIFLEVERFDRVNVMGRRGIVSLRTLGLEFAGRIDHWKGISEEILKRKIINSETHQRILRLELFGKLIGNSDMHAGNLSFYFDKLKLMELAPVYDMLPMMYAPRQNQIVEKNFKIELPTPDEGNIWIESSEWAREFWRQASLHPQISRSFQSIANANDDLLCRAIDKAKEILP